VSDFDEAYIRVCNKLDTVRNENDQLRAEVERLKAENEAFMALPTWADVTLARLAGAEAALRYCWVEDYTEDDIQRGLQAINQQASAHPGDCEPSNQEPERP